jgi:pimeloyl-ACP methyl ester carboxylesterase
VKNAVLALLSRDGAGCAIALAPALAGAALVAGGNPLARAAGGLLLGTGAVLCALSLRHVRHMAGVRRQQPPPGRLVDVGGFRMHVLAEGESHGRPAVVWMAGAHGSGYAIHHLHRRLREEARSILVDRPGTGWSDAGPFPRTTPREADEILRALAAAGEKGPFVWVGHSFGGLLVANIARRRPDLVATLVLLDPTPLETIVFGPRLGDLRAMVRNAWRTLARRLFGIYTDPDDASAQQNPYFAQVLATVSRELGEAQRVNRLLEHGTRAWAAMASIFDELSPEGIARDAWNMVVYDGDLGNLPVVLVAPQDMVEFDTLPEASQAPHAGGAGRDEARRMQRFFLRTRERYLAASSRSTRVVPPAGTGHNFPYEAPGFVIDVVRGCLEAYAMPNDAARAQG